MVWCGACKADVDAETEAGNGFLCCPQCGRVLEDTAFSADVTFQKDAGGESTVLGQFVSESGQARGIGRIHGGRVYTSQTDSHERAQAKGRHQIAQLVEALMIRPREESVESAHRLYRLALQRGFTRGRRTNHVAAACLYLLCRQDGKPFLLIDFSDRLQINVFTLGAVFLQLARMLRLEDHPMFSKPIDPSLYINRFTNLLGFEGAEAEGISTTAVRLVASMKRDWIQTGRRPSGICGAALFIATHIHGKAKTKHEVIKVVNVGEATLSRRLQEFSATETAALTVEDLDARHLELEAALKAAGSLPPPPTQAELLLEGPSGAGGCEHVRIGQPHFAHGLCSACYVSFLEQTGGMHNGSNPPAFIRAREREDRAAMLALGPAVEGGEEDEERWADGEVAAGMAAALEAAEMRSYGALLGSADGDGGGHWDDGVARDGERAGSEPASRPLAGAVATQGEGAAAAPVPAGEPTSASPSAAAAAEAEEAACAEEAAAPPRKRPRAVFQRYKPRRRSTATTTEEAAAADGGSIKDSGVVPVIKDSLSATVGAGHTSTVMAATGASSPPVNPGSPLASEEAGAPAEAGAVLLVPPGEEEGKGGEEEEEEECLSDIPDDDIDMYLANDTEVAFKEEIWNMMNREWLERQATKAAIAAATERAASEQRAAQEAAEAAGVAYKRSRGRPLGSKSKPRAESALTPAETPQEAAMRMLDNRKLSSKINYTVLADLFDDPGAAVADPGAPDMAGGGGGDRGPDAETAAAASAAAAAAASQDKESAALSAELRASRTGATPLGGLASLGTGPMASLRPSGLSGALSRSRLTTSGALGRSRPAGLSSPRGEARRVRFAPAT